MKKDVYNVIGLMSGTSLDGIDLVYVKFYFKNNWDFTILHSETIDYSDFWVDKLRNLISTSQNELDLIDNAYTEYLANIIKIFIKKNSITKLDAICSHGHTALHKPEQKLTYQIGNKSVISKLLGYTIVCDFRVQDVNLGGQGAPLVPIGDKLLFSEYDFCLNLGGFVNISMESEGERIAYDICPANIVLNYYMKQLGFDYDDEGNAAKSGRVNNILLYELNELDFYNQTYPKSLGLEWVKSHVLPLIDSFKLEVKDVLSTFCEHVAIQISKEINKKKNASVLVTGGGTYNTYLILRLKFYSQNDIIIPNKTVIEFKEALIFAFLGVLKLRGEVNCLKSVTGASKNHSTGLIYLP